MPTINEMIDFCEDMAAYDCFSNEQFARRDMFYAIADELKKKNKYRKWTISEVRWCAKMLFNIPTAYDIDGEIRAWREKYRPETVAAIREREQAFIKEYCKKQETEHKQIHCPAPELKQMDMWEWMAKNGT